MEISLVFFLKINPCDKFLVLLSSSGNFLAKLSNFFSIFYCIHYTFYMYITGISLKTLLYLFGNSPCVLICISSDTPHDYFRKFPSRAGEFLRIGIEWRNFLENSLEFNWNLFRRFRRFLFYFSTKFIGHSPWSFSKALLPNLEISSYILQKYYVVIPNLFYFFDSLLLRVEMLKTVLN